MAQESQRPAGLHVIGAQLVAEPKVPKSQSDTQSISIRRLPLTSVRFKKQKEELTVVLYSFFYAGLAVDSPALIPVLQLLDLIRDYAMDLYTEAIEVVTNDDCCDHKVQFPDSRLFRNPTNSDPIDDLCAVNRDEYLIMQSNVLYRVSLMRETCHPILDGKTEAIEFCYDRQKDIVYVLAHPETSLDFRLMTINRDGQILRQQPVVVPTPPPVQQYAERTNKAMQRMLVGAPQLNYDGSCMYVAYAYDDEDEEYWHGLSYLFAIDTTSGTCLPLRLNNDNAVADCSEIVLHSTKTKTHLCVMQANSFCVYTKKPKSKRTSTSNQSFQRRGNITYGKFTIARINSGMVWTPSGHMIVAIHERDYVHLYYRKRVNLDAKNNNKKWTRLTKCDTKFDADSKFDRESSKPYRALEEKTKWEPEHAIGHVKHEARFQKVLFLSLLVDEQSLMIVMGEFNTKDTGKSLVVKYPLPAFFFLPSR